jgi:hypothetical protein
MDDGSTYEKLFKDIQSGGHSINELIDKYLPEAGTDSSQISAPEVTQPESVDDSNRVEPASDRTTLKAKLRTVESGGNDQAHSATSSASGRYQFTDATWKQLGGDPAKRNDPAEQERLIDKLIDQNEHALVKAGNQPTDGNLYLAHFLGAGGAINALADPNAPVSAKVQEANPFTKGWRNGQLAAWANRKMGGKPGIWTSNPNTAADRAFAEKDKAADGEELQPLPEDSKPFDSEEFNRSRNETIKASKAAGNQHLDDLEPAVETMRGKQIFYAHDPKITGTVRTVANTGEVVVHWNDKYSAEKELATERTVGSKTVQESWLQPSDLKDYVVGKPRSSEAAAAAEPTPQLSKQDQLKAKLAANRFVPFEEPTLGIPRAEMPQIQAEHRGAMVNFLNARGIEHQEETVPADSLKPSQTEYSPAKVQQALDFTGGDRAILVSQDGYVVDGHHQWLAAKQNGEDVRIIRLQAPIRQVLQQAHAFPSSESEAKPSFLDKHGIDRSDVVAVVDAANVVRNAKAPYGEREAFRKGAADALGGGGFRESFNNVDLNNPAHQTAYEAGQKAAVREMQRRGATGFAPESSSAFDPQAHVAAMRDLVRNSNVSLGDLAAIGNKLGLQPDQAHRVLGALAAQPNSGIFQTKGRPEKRNKAGKIVQKAVPARFQRHGTRQTPLHLLEFVRSIGGVRNDEGHDLRNVGALARYPGVISSKGMSVDKLGEALHEAGYVHTGGRPSEHDVIDLLDRASHKRIYAREDINTAAGLDQESQVEDETQHHIDELQAVAAEHDLELPEHVIQSALQYLAAGESHEYAVEAAVRDEAAASLEELSQLSGDQSYANAVGDIYEGEFAERRGEAAPQGVAGQSGSALGEAAGGRRGEQSGEAAKQAQNQAVSTAPEHATVGVDSRELSEIVVDFNSVRASQGEGEDQITHIFDPPAKGEIVRLNERTRVYHKEHGWMTPEEARAKIREWEQHAVDQGKDMLAGKNRNNDKIVLSFFDLSGEWSAPWDQAGYQVWRFDIQNDPEMGDVNNFSTDFFGDWFGDFEGLDIHAILAACPCTDFAVSGARHFAAKDKDGRTVESVKLVQQTLAAIEHFKPAVWAIENPVGRIEKLGGLPPWRLSFDPNDIGETYTKKTLLWGRFNAELPIAPVEPVEGSKMHKQFGGKSLKTKNARSVTPEGFAYSFFMANNAIDNPAMTIANKYDRLDRGLIEQAVKAGVTEDQIDEAVEDHYYADLNDEAANDALRGLIDNKANPLAPRATDTAEHLQRKADEGLKPTAEQKPVGSDGGLFDTQDTTGDLFDKGASKTVTPTDPVEKAKAALQQAMDALEGQQQEQAKPAEQPKSPQERGLQPLFDEDNPEKQIGFFDPATGKVEKQLEDAGEKIGGARKDMWAQRGLALADLENMSRGEAHQFVTKDNVWPKPDYGKVVESGVPAEVAAGVKLLRDSLAAKPKEDSDEGRRNFIEAMQAAREVLDNVKTVDDLRGVQSKLYEKLGVQTGLSYSYNDEFKASRKRLFSIFKGRNASFQIDYKMRRKIEALVAAGWPAQGIEPWTRRFDVRLSRTREGETWFVTDKNRRIVGDNLPTKEAAEAKAKELYEGLTKNPDGTKKAPERPHLDRLERTGKDIRAGRDVSPDDFLKDFGFRGVEFGNWVANDERQKAVNLAYEGLHDLADTLGIPAETLSLGGQLGLAFGARGTGRAAAHYEPGKLVINLTKLSGAGSLAHEWGHALDHYFGTLDSDQGTRGAPKYASGGRDAYSFKALGNLRPDLASSFDKVMDALFHNEKSRAEMIRAIEQRIENVQAGIARQQESIKAYRDRPAGTGTEAYAKAFIKKSEDWIATQRDVVLLGLGKRLAGLTDESKPLKADKVESSFYKNAQALSGKSGKQGYWARPTELFARSFESYVFDRIKDRGNVSQYLVQGVEGDRYQSDKFAGNPYPTGEERAKIDAAFDKLFEAVDVRGIPAPREGGPTKALYQVSSAPPFYSALERAIDSSGNARAPAAQWLATLKKVPGVKQEELSWSGIEDWLNMQEGPVDKAVLQQLIRDGGIKVDEVVLGRPIEERLADYGYDVADMNDFEHEANLIANEGEAQFSSWSSDPHNDSYRELLITLPLGEGNNPARAPATHWDTEAVVAHARFMDKTDADGKLVLFVEEVQSDWHQKGRDQGYQGVANAAEVEAARKADDEAGLATTRARLDFVAAVEAIRLKQQAEPGSFFSFLGIDLKTPLLDKFGGITGVGPVLETEDRAAKVLDRIKSLAKGKSWEGDIAHAEKLEDDLSRAQLRDRETRQHYLNLASGRGIPDAPFKSSWPALVMKRMIRWATDNGYDKIAWTTGEEQAQRYNLSQALGEMNVRAIGDGTYHVGINNVNASRIVIEQFGKGPYTPEKLTEMFGRDLAQRIQSMADAKGGQWERVAGDDLRVGGEGMKAFYDRNLVNITNDIIKKYGVKVGQVGIARVGDVEMETDREFALRSELLKIETSLGRESDEWEAKRQEWLAERNKTRDSGLPHPGFEITPQLAQAATSGFALFRHGDPAANITDEQRQTIATDTSKLLKQMIPGDRIGLKFADMLADGGRFNGQYFMRVISLAYDAQNPTWTLSHEALHAMKAMGLFTPTEWNLLVKNAWDNRPSVQKVIREGWGHLGLTEDQLKEEAVAEMFGAQVHIMTRDEKSFVARMLRRLGHFLSAVYGAIHKLTGNEKGATAVDAYRLMEKMRTGKIGSREEGFGEKPRDRPGRPTTVTFGNKAPTPSFSVRSPTSIEDNAEPRLWAPLRALIGSANAEDLGEKLDSLRTTFQDRMLPVMRTQAAVERMLGRKISDDENPYLAEELFHGRTGARLETLTGQHIEPLFDAMRKAKITPEELETFLYARHAPERNARIASINPDFAAGTGSGMTDAEAASIMAAVDASGKRADLEVLAKRVDALNAFSLQTRVDSGLLSKEEANAWNQSYQHYVPLRGRPGENEEMSGFIRRQSGYSVRGKESQRAFGRKTKAQDILPYSILQAEEAIVRAEQNEVARAFLELAKSAPDPDFWKIDKIKRVPVFNKSTGLVSYRNESRIAAEDAPFTVSAKVAGVEHRITMNRDNPAAVRTAAAMRNLNIQQFQFVVRTFGTVNRLMSAMITRFSPDFIVSNAFRDLQTATVNLAGVDVKGLEHKVLRDYPAALVAATKGEFGRGSGEWAKWYREFKMQGGHVAFNDLTDISTLRRKVQHAASTASTRLGAKRLLSSMLEVVDNVNGGVENALRLATYKNAVQSGVSPKQAASLAKNVTVNFNRKGTVGPLINSMYLFFNASLQGSARILTAMKSPKVRRILMASVIAGFAMQLLNSWRSDKDKDGDKFYDKIPEFEKEHNIIIMAGEGGRYFKFPMPWGYNVFPNMGRMFARLSQGEKATNAVPDWLWSVVDAFNPVGGAESILRTISPTIADPIVDLVTNRDYAGRPIMPDAKDPGQQVPNSQRYWNSIPPYDKWITDKLNELTGGDSVRPGKVDISPEVLDYLQNTVLGGVGTFGRNMITLGSKGIFGDSSQHIEENDIPLARRVVGNKPAWYDKAAFYARLAQVEQDVTYAKTYIKEGDRSGVQKLVDDDRDVLSLYKIAKAARKDVRKVSKQRNELQFAVDKGAIPAAQAKPIKEQLDAREQRIIDAFNSLYLKHVAQPIRP